MRVAEVEWSEDSSGRPRRLLHIEMSQRYRHTVGFSETFYRGLDEGVLKATRCGGCEGSWFPPRRFCDIDLEETGWYDLPGTGTVRAATRVHVPPPFGGIEVPYILASISLDGVDGGVTHRVLGEVIPPQGTPVQAVFMDESPAHPLLGPAFAVVNPDYSGFPHTGACNASSTRVSG